MAFVARAPTARRRRRRRHRLPAAFGRPKAELGRQPEPLGGAELWIVPNPSGLNAHETIDTLAAAYRAPADRRRPRPRLIRPSTSARLPDRRSRHGRRIGAGAAIMGAVRVAYTLEQCWHDVPGGTAVAALGSPAARRPSRRRRWSASPAATAGARRAVAAADPRRPAAAAAAAALRGVAAARLAAGRAGDRARRRRPRHRSRPVRDRRAARRHGARPRPSCTTRRASPATACG